MGRFACPRHFGSARVCFPAESTAGWAGRWSLCRLLSDSEHTFCACLCLLPRRIRDHVDLKVELSRKDAAVEPVCGEPPAFSMNLYAHLDGVATASDSSLSPEKALGRASWNIAELGGKHTNADMGARVARELRLNASSWVLTNLAAVYWRVRGNAREAVACLQHAISLSPNRVKDVALLQLANVLANTGAVDDARKITELALAVGRPSHALHYLYGRLFLEAGNVQEAQVQFARATSLQPDLSSARKLAVSLMHRLKTIAAPIRRQFEINLRRTTMALPPNETWADFE